MFFLILISLTLISCSNDLFYNESKHQLSVEVYFTSNENETQRTEDTLPTKSIVQFQSRINPLTLDIKDHYWRKGLDSKQIQAWNFKDTFNINGVYTVKFCAIDRFGDTLTKNLIITIASKPTCKDFLMLEAFQGSPTFSWECNDEENSNLSYIFTLKDKDKNEDKVFVLQEKILQLGFALPKNFDVNLIARNKYFFEDEISKEWRDYE